MQAVCYLNTYNENFHGGLFHFQEGEPSTIIPNMGVLCFFLLLIGKVICIVVGISLLCV